MINDHKFFEIESERITENPKIAQDVLFRFIARQSEIE